MIPIFLSEEPVVLWCCAVGRVGFGSILCRLVRGFKRAFDAPHLLKAGMAYEYMSLLVSTRWIRKLRRVIQ